ncbi:carboxypeptidase regulatory-like domain-containing protein [Streptomyces sp. NBC_01013]|uniref:carboxypeptidase regulatory-like domain-containing protein n=1 Tax=Streptomyces sp. NBC_01013 TaxID=2903718 RepID=UPI00386F2E36|nr:carboxypeptidase regulatory-like domain-containing protein [Streptomyces sp. NBC_01013]
MKTVKRAGDTPHVPRALRSATAVLGLTALVILGVQPAAQAGTPAGPAPSAMAEATATTPTRLAPQPSTAVVPTSDELPADGRTDDLEPVCGVPAEGRARCYAMRAADEAPVMRLSAAQTPAGLGPQDIQSAYSLPSDGGSGQTIAIVDANDNPNAEADLAVYRSQYGLPPCTTENGCFKKVDQRGGTHYPPTDEGWAGEIALDLDMVSAAAPHAHILLVETDNAGLENLGAGVDLAVSMGAKYVSNSYGRSGDSPADASSWGAHYDHPGIAIVAASGDFGYGLSFPSTLSTVTSVGGTNLVADPDSTRGWSETVWQRDFYGPGSGCATYQPKPDFQMDTGCAGRSVADVSAVADNLAVYHSFGSTGTGWMRYGGTSASTPLIAAVYALAGAPRPATYPNSYPYKGDGAGLNDIASGSNGDCDTEYLCTAVAGYDGPTGLGTPSGLAAFRGGPSGILSGVVTDAKSGKPLAGAIVGSGADVASTLADGSYTLNLPAGTVEGLTVTMFGYTTTEPITVEIAEDQTRTQDLALQPIRRVHVRGKVRDGSGHGWPLYARLAVEGSPEAPAWTDPATGEYDILLPKGSDYSLDVTAVLPGYEAATREVTVAGRAVTAHVSLTADPDAATAVGYTPQVTDRAEPFDSTIAAPGGWTVTNAEGTDNGWQFDDPIQRGNYTGGSGTFAVVDSDSGPFGPHQDTYLTTAAYDLSDAQSAELTFGTAYLANISQQHMTVDASADDGATWANVWAGPKVSGDAQKLTVRVPLRKYAGDSSVKLRFHFVANWGYYWAIDDVNVRARTLLPVSGGLAVGTVNDAGTGEGVVGATVVDASAPDTGVLTAATPDDPAVGEGFYTLFLAEPGRHTLTVGASGYDTVTRKVRARADRVVTGKVRLRADS